LIYLDEVAAKVAAHAADCYKEAYTSAKTESAKKIIPEVCLSNIYYFNQKQNFMLVIKRKLIENMDLK
jgi:hypothetical protein